MKHPLAPNPPPAALDGQWVRPWLDPSDMQDDLTSGFRGLWASSGQQGPIPTSGAVLQVVTVVEAEQLQDWTHSLPFPGLWPSSQVYIWNGTLVPRHKHRVSRACRRPHCPSHSRL